MSGSDPQHGPDPPVGEGGTHVVIARSGDHGAAAYCRDRLTRPGRPASAPLVVLVGEPGARRSPVTVERDRQGVIVMVEEDTGMGDAGELPVSDDHPATVTAPGDLGAVGQEVDEYLMTWARAGYRPVVCVDSLDGLLAHTSIRGAYRFLYVLDRRLTAVAGDLHVHVDPGDHEEEILRTFLVMADRTVSFGDHRQIR